MRLKDFGRVVVSVNWGLELTNLCRLSLKIAWRYWRRSWHGLGCNVAISTIFLNKVQCEVFCRVHNVVTFVVLTFTILKFNRLKEAKSCKCMLMHNCWKNCVGHAKQAGHMQTGFHTSQTIDTTDTIFQPVLLSSYSLHWLLFLSRTWALWFASCIQWFTKKLAGSHG